MHALGKKYALKRSPPDHRDFVHVPALSHTKALPPAVDLRNQMPPVLDQSTLGSCALNATSNCLRHLLRTEHNVEFQPSRLYMYWNTRVNIEHGPADEDTGVCIRDVCKAVRAYHVCDEVVWPYDISKFCVAPPLQAYESANLHTTLRYAYVPQNVDSMRRTIASGLPVIIGLQLYDSFESAEVAATGVVPMPDLANEQCLGGHAVLAVGYDDSKEVFIVMNSWGTSWGQQGYFEIPYAYVLDPELASNFWTLSSFA